jgi:hypothetical protein
VNGFIDNLYTRLGTTNNYSAIADVHSLQIARAYAKSSQFAFTIRSQVTDSNNEILQFLCSRLCPWLILHNLHHSPLLFSLDTDRIENSVSRCSSIIVCAFIAVESHLFAEALLSNSCTYLLFLLSLHSNGSTCHKMNMTSPVSCNFYNGWAVPSTSTNQIYLGKISFDICNWNEINNLSISTIIQ